MSIVERIQEQYPIRYYVMDEVRAMSVALTFHPDIPQMLSSRLQDVLTSRFALSVGSQGQLCLELCPDTKPNCYQLRRDGNVCYRFGDRTPFLSGDRYASVDAIAWVVYILATNREASWLSNYREEYLSCHTFCARQQTLAAQYRYFAECQFRTGHYSREHYKKQCEALAQYSDEFVEQAPCFSGQPIREDGFAALRKGMAGVFNRSAMPIAELSRKLFGDSRSFLADVDVYCNYIQTRPAYKKQLADAVAKLNEDLDKVPVMSAGRYLDELKNYIGNEEVGELTLKVDTQIIPVRKRQTLVDALTVIDNACHNYIKKRIRKAFLLAVLEQTAVQVKDDLQHANAAVQEARSELTKFSVCATPSDRKVSWKHLAKPENANLYIPEIDWNVESFSDLQRNVTDNCLWICSNALMENMQRENPSAAGMALTQSVHISDDQYVVAFWRS